MVEVSKSVLLLRLIQLLPQMPYGALGGACGRCPAGDLAGCRLFIAVMSSSAST